MIRNIIGVLVLSVAILTAGVFVMVDNTVAVTCPSGSLRSEANTLAECNIEPDQPGKGLMSTVKTVINVIIGLVGVISVVMIIIGGITFATSSGDPQKTKKGKDTVLFAVVGLVVAILAFAIVNFALTSVFGG